MLLLKNELDKIKDQDNQQLWDLFKNGDLEAWEELFLFFYNDLYSYGLKLSTQSELTEDCIHELFVELWDRREHLSEATSVKAYLLASLRRKILRKLKKKRKHSYNVDNIEDDIAGKIQFSPEEIIIQKETQKEQLKTVYEAIEHLPDRQKEVLYLRYFNGMSYDEIEEILDINYQSLRNYVYRAIKRLKNILNNNISSKAISLLLFFPPYFI